MVIEVTATAATSLVLGFWPLTTQIFDPNTLLNAPSSVRAVAALFATILFGGAVIYLYGGRLDGAVDASMGSPLSSTLYGIMTYGGAFFLVGYAYSQLLRIEVTSTAVLIVAGIILISLLLTLSGFGFVIVGCWLSELFGPRDPWLGLIGLGTAGAFVWFLLPAVVGVAVWFSVGAVGIGGPARLWLHDDTVKLDRS